MRIWFDNKDHYVDYLEINIIFLPPQPMLSNFMSQGVSKPLTPQRCLPYQLRLESSNIILFIRVTMNHSCQWCIAPQCRAKWLKNEICYILLYLKVNTETNFIYHKIKAKNISAPILKNKYSIVNNQLV